jgi:cytochrome c oxidase subunit 2
MPIPVPQKSPHRVSPARFAEQAGGKERQGVVRIGDTRQEYTHLFDVYVPIAIAVFVVILALVVFVVLRFRSSSREFPAGGEGSRAGEGAYALVVGCVVAALLYLTYESMSDIEASERQARGPRVDVTAAKWNWTFRYPDSGVTQLGSYRRPTTLVVPVDTPVRFRMTSIDVIHAFWVPAQRFKRDAFPARTTTFVLRFGQEGFMRRAGECNQFCGLLHSSMDFNVDVVGKAEFRRWLRDKRKAAG